MQRLFICCCKGFFRDEKRDELYQLLEVDRRATPVEIKRAYRNKSLEMHPDKLNQRGQEVTEQDRAKFQKMKGAYDVLSDPQKREVYDQLGETGMMMMEDPFAAKDNMVKNFLKMGTRDRLRLVIFVLLFVGAVLLWPILFCSKVDGELSASWVALWTPLWVYNALGLYYYLYLVSLGKMKAPEGMEEQWTDSFPLHMRVLGLVKWILVVLFQIFLTMRLDDDIDWTWAAVGSPLLVLMGLQLVGHLYEGSKPIPKARNEESILEDEEAEMGPDSDKRDQAIAKRTEARAAVIKDCIWMLQLVFLILELDEEVDWSWWLVFLPTWLVLFGQLMSYCLDFSMAQSLAAGLEDKDEEELSQEEKGRVSAASQLTAQASTACCCWMFTLVTVILAVNAIAGADYSAFIIFIPQFIIAGVLVCCLTCFICCMRMDPDEVLGPNGGGGDPEQGTGTTVPHTQASYGTYNPPAMGGVPGTGGAGKGSASPSAAPIVIAMPPPASTPQVGVLPTPPVAPPPIPFSTPAPDTQEDGGID